MGHVDKVNIDTNPVNDSGWVADKMLDAYAAALVRKYGHDIPKRKKIPCESRHDRHGTDMETPCAGTKDNT
jgi:hypothetical protein